MRIDARHRQPREVVVGHLAEARGCRLVEDRLRLIETPAFAQRERENRAEPRNAGVGLDGLLDHGDQLAEPPGLERNRRLLGREARERIRLAVLPDFQRRRRESTRDVEFARDDRKVGLVGVGEPERGRIAEAVGDLPLAGEPVSSSSDVTGLDRRVAPPVVGVEPLQLIAQALGGRDRLDRIRETLDVRMWRQ